MRSSFACRSPGYSAPRCGSFQTVGTDEMQTGVPVWNIFQHGIIILVFCTPASQNE